MPTETDSVESTVVHSFSPSLILSFNPNKVCYFTILESQSNMPSELHSILSSIKPSILPSVMTSTYYSDTPSGVPYLQPSSPTALE